MRTRERESQQGTQTHSFHNNKGYSAWMVWCDVLVPSLKPPWNLPLKSSGLNFTRLCEAHSMWQTQLLSSESHSSAGEADTQASRTQQWVPLGDRLWTATGTELVGGCERGGRWDGRCTEGRILLHVPENGLGYSSVLGGSRSSPTPAGAPWGHSPPAACDFEYSETAQMDFPPWCREAAEK